MAQKLTIGTPASRRNMKGTIDMERHVHAGHNAVAKIAQAMDGTGEIVCDRNGIAIGTAFDWVAACEAVAETYGQLICDPGGILSDDCGVIWDAGDEKTLTIYH